MHSLFDTDSKGFLSEDELGALLEVLCDVVDRLGLLPIASQDEIDTMVVEAMTTPTGTQRYAQASMMCSCLRPHLAHTTMQVKSGCGRFHALGTDRATGATLSWHA